MIEENLEAGMRNFMRSGYKGVTETWNVLQHEVQYCDAGIIFFAVLCSKLCLWNVNVLKQNVQL